MQKSLRDNKHRSSWGYFQSFSDWNIWGLMQSLLTLFEGISLISVSFQSDICSVMTRGNCLEAPHAGQPNAGSRRGINNATNSDKMQYRE